MNKKSTIDILRALTYSETYFVKNGYRIDLSDEEKRLITDYLEWSYNQTHKGVITDEKR